MRQSLRLYKPSKVMEPNHEPSTNPHPQEPHPHCCWTPPWMGTPSLLWAVVVSIADSIRFLPREVSSSAAGPESSFYLVFPPFP